MVDNKNGNPTKPQVGPNQGSAKPAVSPGNTKPNNTPKHKQVDTTGTPAFLATGVPASEILDDAATGFVGVDPIYQNAANATEMPKGTRSPVEPE